MNFSEIIIFLMALFSILGAFDRVFGNHFGLGKAWENGIVTIGQLTLSMIGIMVLAPVISDIFTPIITPIFSFINADPSVFAGSIFACDMGGAPLSSELAQNSEAARFSGILIASTLGATVSFTIPVALTSIKNEDITFAAKGILCGVVTVPAGVVLSGIVAGFSFAMVLKNTLPVLLISILIAVGLYKFERTLINGFIIFGKLITAVATVGLVCAGIQLTTDIVIIKGLGSINEAFSIVGEIAIVLSGALPLMYVIRRVFSRPMKNLGHALKVNNNSVAGIVAILANSIAAFDLIKDMDDRGKVINMAFAVSGAFVFGDHLAFTAGYAPEMIPSLIVCKLFAGVLSIILALFITREKQNV